MKGPSADTDSDVLLNSIAGLAFAEWLLISLSVWVASHFGLVFLNFMKMDCSLLLHFLSSCAPNCFPFQYCDLLPESFPFPFSYWLIAPCRTSLSLQTSLLASINPSSIKCSTIQLWDKGYSSFWTALPISSQHHTDEQAVFGRLSSIGWILSCLLEIINFPYTL